FSVAILGEGVTVIQATGGALILLGVYLMQKSESRENSVELLNRYLERGHSSGRQNWLNPNRRNSE
ncbi:MAG: DMT family transporter, partial [Thaumarchaeota archaeon]|nr:DMT family transporter [Nitrososphaerota archaeon]